MTKIRSLVKTLIFSTSFLFLNSCQTTLDENPKQTLGSILGAGVGGLLGAQFGEGKGQLAAVAIGALAGTYFGNEIGQSLDRADKMYMDRNAEKSLEMSKSGTTTTWSNPDSGNSGSFKPTSVFKSTSGKNCRDFETTIYVEGKSETATGRACRENDGTWKIIS